MGWIGRYLVQSVCSTSLQRVDFSAHRFQQRHFICQPKEADHVRLSYGFVGASVGRRFERV